MKRQKGSIVWISVLDPQGRNPKTRPAVLLSDPAETEFVVVAIS